MNQAEEMAKEPAEAVSMDDTSLSSHVSAAAAGKKKTKQAPVPYGHKQSAAACG